MADIHAILSTLFPKRLVIFIAYMALVGLLFAVSMTVLARRERGVYLKKWFLLRILLFLLIVSGVATLLNLATSYVGQVFSQRTITTKLQIVGSMTVLLIGTCAYVVRLQRQFWYGALEVAAAVLVAINTMGTAKPNQETLAQDTALIGAAYIVVRGLNNMVEGKLGKVTTLDELVLKTLEKIAPEDTHETTSDPRNPPRSRSTPSSS